MAALAGALACDRERAGAPASGCGPTGPAPASGPWTGSWSELDFGPSQHWPEPEHAVVLAVRDAPLLVALHGAGEVARGVPGGARGWRDFYDLDRAHGRLGRPPLTAADLHGFVRPERLALLNGSLAAHPYRGLCVACPYTPRLLDRSAAGAQGFAAFLLRVLVPALRARTELGVGKGTGIDGVSMGGRLALLIGLGHPEAFDSVGALQPAITVAEAAELASMAARAGVGKKLRLRLVSSDEDPFLEPVRALSAQLERQGVAHSLVVTPGPHDYEWNEGPGSYELLWWHERVLRGLPTS
jgi:pimeloyl-ACP methyl ester carboxylesterase